MKDSITPLKPARRNTIWPLLALLALLLLAFALRVYRLPAQSLWYDEGVSWYLTRMSLPDLTVWTANDIQPPLYYYLLWLWARLAGTGEYALRFPSVFFGVLTLPLLWVTARRLLGKRAAWLAALFLALSPLHVYYAQEARMYTLLTFLGLLSSYLLLRLLNNQSTNLQSLYPWSYVLTAVAALYTHYFAFFLLAAHALYVLYKRGQQVLSAHSLRPCVSTSTSASTLTSASTSTSTSPSTSASASTSTSTSTSPSASASTSASTLTSTSTSPSASASTSPSASTSTSASASTSTSASASTSTSTLALISISILLLYLPWLPFLLTRYGLDTSYWPGTLKLGEVARKLFIAFSLGETVTEAFGVWLAVGYALIFLISLAMLLRSIYQPANCPIRNTQYAVRTSPTDSLVFLLLYLLVPIALVLLSVYRTPKFNPRYAMLASPAFILFIAGGLSSLISHHAPRTIHHTPRSPEGDLMITSYVSRFTLHASRFTLHASRFTLHASRFTLHVLSPPLLSSTSYPPLPTPSATGSHLIPPTSSTRPTSVSPPRSSATGSGRMRQCYSVPVTCSLPGPITMAGVAGSACPTLKSWT